MTAAGSNEVRFKRRRRHNRRLLLLCIGLSSVIHLSLLLPRFPGEPAQPLPALLPQKFHKRLAPDRRPLARSSLRRPPRPLERKPALRTTPAAAVSPAAPAVQSGALAAPVPLIRSAGSAASLPLPLPMTARRIGPTFRAGAIEGERQAGEEIDLRMELLDVEALDTGQHRAVVVVDPGDRKKIKGFLYLSGVYSPSLEQAELDAPFPRVSGTSRRVAERRMLQGLADKMSERTQVRTEVLDGLPLDDPRLLRVPFLLLTILHTFNFTDAEAKNLGRYLTSGGFLYAEVVSWAEARDGGFYYDGPALRAFVREAFRQVGYAEGREWRFVRLEQDHPLYRCYHDIKTLPRGFWDVSYWYWEASMRREPSPDYLEGIEVHGRLAGLYSLKNYADFWAGEAERIRERDERAGRRGRFDIGGEELPVYDLGINVLVYALTRERSLARKLVAVQ